MDLTKKINKFAERFWLLIAICSSVAVVVFRIIDGYFNQYYLLLVPFTWGIYLVRRGLRIRLNRVSSQKDQKK